MITISLSYLVVNFLFDFFEVSKIWNRGKLWNK
jgi:uncharacterized membrane protein YwzB